MKKPERNEQCNVVESNISLPNAEKEFKAGVNKANDNINNKDKSPLLKRIDTQLASTNKQRTNNETKKNYNLQYSVTISPSKNQVDENIDIQSDEDSSVSSPTLNRKSINLQKNNLTTTPQKEHLFSSNKGLKSLDKDKRNCDDNNPKNDSLLKNLTCNKSRFSEPIVFIDHIERHSKLRKEQEADSLAAAYNKLSNTEERRDINIFGEDPNLRHFDTSIHSANHDSKQSIDFSLR